MSQNSDLSNLVSSSGFLVCSGKPFDSVMFPNNAHTDHSFLIDVPQKKLQTNVQDGSNDFLKGFIGVPQNNLHDKADYLECPIAKCPEASNCVGYRADICVQSIPSYLDSQKRDEHSPFVNPTFQNPINVLKDSDFSRINSADDNLIVNSDAALSSIELRLGQPLQMMGHPVLSVSGPQLFDVNLPNSQFPEQMIHNTSPLREEELLQRLCNVAGSSNLNIVGKQSQLKVGSHGSGVSNAMDAVRQAKLSGNVANRFMVSPLTHPNFQPEGRVHLKANDHSENYSRLIMPKILHCESKTVNCDCTSVHSKSNDGLEKNLNTSQLGLNRCMGNGKVVGCVTAGCYTEVDTDFRISKHMEDSISFNRVMSGSSYYSIPPLHEKNNQLHHHSSIPLDASAATNSLGNLRNILSPGKVNHISLESTGTKLASGLATTSQGLLTGFPFSTSTSALDWPPTLPRQGGATTDPCLLDESMRLHALTQRLELSKKHALYYCGMNQMQGRSGSFSKVQHSMFEPSTSGLLRQVPDTVQVQDVSEVTMVSSQNIGNYGIKNDLEKLASLKGLNTCCHLSTLAYVKEKGLQCNFSRDPFQNEEPSLRVGTVESINRSSEPERFCETAPYTCLRSKYNCASLGRNLVSGVENSCTFSEQNGKASDEASLVIASEFGEHQNVSKNDHPIYFEQSGKLNRNLPKSIGSCTSHWRDVPSKLKGFCDASPSERSAKVLYGKGQDVDQFGNPAKHFNEAVQLEDSSKEQELSNVSSGSSAPVVTQVSVEVKNMDSSTIEVGDTRYDNNLIVDESSGIDKGWSSDGAFESERSAEFCGSTPKIHLRKCYARVLNYQPSRSLLDELKLLDSLTWKKGHNKKQTVLPVDGKTNHSPNLKRKKDGELKMLDVSSPTETPNLHNENCKSTGISEFPPSLFKKMHTQFASGGQICIGACFAQPCDIHILPASSSSRSISCNSSPCNLYNGKERLDSLGERANCDGGFCPVPDVSGRKKLRRDFSSDASWTFKMQNQTHEAAENAKFKVFSRQQLNVCRKHKASSIWKIW
ncbi:Histone-lysine N-methyltransferase TRX1 [Quillaja saponaria]|uniref:Histone-lysine N-methyltransferase TRX1 n=1 Tax=Quillaja saponaria TaxID=32244 RepID=A0AAD7PTF8_QUISA|nr:Histone-lysine N-methyltransferase TRX1 [Quillaja saponaria]